MPRFQYPQDVVLRANNGERIKLTYKPAGVDTLATITGEIRAAKGTDSTKLVTDDGEAYFIWWSYERKVPNPGEITTTATDTDEVIGEFHDAEVV